MKLHLSTVIPKTIEELIEDLYEDNLHLYTGQYRHPWEAEVACWEDIEHLWHDQLRQRFPTLAFSTAQALLRKRRSSFRLKTNRI